MIVKLDSKRRLTLPAGLGEARPGEYFEVLYDEDSDSFRLTRVKRKESWLDILKQCPVPMDDIPPRSRQLPKKLKL